MPSSLPCIAWIGTDGVEAAGGEFITPGTKAAAQMGPDLLSGCPALMRLVIFCYRTRHLVFNALHPLKVSKCL